MREVGDSLQHDLADNVHIVFGMVQLVQLEDSQVSLQIVGVFTRLHFDILLQQLQVFRIVSARKTFIINKILTIFGLCVRASS